MEYDSETRKTKISDSAYSTSFCKSNSHGSASSKSLLSGSNCSSGYGGVVNAENVDNNLPALTKRNKDKENKKSKSESTNMSQMHVAPSDFNQHTNGLITNPDSLHLELFSKIDIIDIVSPKTNEMGTDNISDSNVKQSEHVLPDNLTPNTKVIEPKNGFCCVISMYDGIVLYTSPSLTPLLGFPKNMWLGRSFSDFLHPKDRETFCNEITNEIAIPIVEGTDRRKDIHASFYVCLREYRGLKTSGYSVVERAVSYQAFHLSVKLKYTTPNINKIPLPNGEDTFLIIVAVPVYSNYALPDEVKKSSIFGMRHTSACIFNQVDADVVMNFGYLPQQMLGKSVFDFYHPEDLPFMKEVYESVMVKCQIAGSVYRSKPYRFAVQNGDFVMIETEWSCFINPWSRRLEFVIGLHRVLQGPSNPNIFEAPKEDKNKLASDQVLKDAEIIREEILHILNKELYRPSKLPQREVARRCKNLETFMENIIECSKPNQCLDPVPKDGHILYGSNNLGSSSPRNEDCDRDSFETPPSYTQLNYNENINRFFKSKPMTNGSDESGRTAHVDQVLKCSSSIPMCNHRVSGSGSTGNISSGSNLNIEGSTSTSNGSYEPLLLTEELILRHNEDMEKMMRQRHKEQRSTMKPLPNAIVKNESITVNHDQQRFEQFQGVKRSGSLSWEAETVKVLKQKHLANEKRNTTFGSCSHNISSNFAGKYNSNVIDKGNTSGVGDLPLWPPFPLTVNSLNSNQSNAPGVVPVYYIPSQRKTPSDYGEVTYPPAHEVQYIRGVMYNPVFPSPVFCTPMAMVPFSLPQPVAPFIPDSKTVLKSTLSGRQRSTSRATSVKAEPGSAIGSNVSASCVNRTVETVEDKFVDSAPYDEGSSHSSSYSSFFKTDNGFSSNEDSAGENGRKDKNNITNKILQRAHAVRKCDPVWMQAVNVTPDLIYRYQMSTMDLDEVLKADHNAMENVKQPDFVNEQLHELYLSMEDEQKSPTYNLYGSVSSSEQEYNNYSDTVIHERMANSILMMIYEENAALPSSDH
ncbi:hypothetical protein PPYR_09520 [Photinus pyralis]|uniref:Period circadian protein n=2 Tax=Photinus pyralis TaxID=7054 RepID=A0A5N4AMI0_PHOPY|nr:hypothetical protein PPYR_09520 [Photinus pyralis]